MASSNLGGKTAVFGHVLITGSPGVGKTTLVKKVLDSKRISGHYPVCGFLTQEVRDPTSRQRTGFDVLSLQGYPDAEIKSASLARTRKTASHLPAGPNVGSYYIDVSSFESVALPSMSHPGKQTCQKSMKCVLCVLDEIGKMELLSASFKTSVEQVFAQKNIVVLATVPLNSSSKGLSLVNELKNRSNIKLYEVTRENRNALVSEIESVVIDLLNA